MVPYKMLEENVKMQYTSPRLEQNANDEMGGVVAQGIQSFRAFLRDEIGYSQEARDLLDRGLLLCLTHEHNRLENKRLRKIDKVPYIFHPLEMAQEAARMHLHPTLILACLLHDVPEDVRFGTLESPQAWIRHIADVFADYHDKDRLIRILETELKTEALSSKFPLSEQRNQVVDYYLKSPLGKTAVQYLSTLRVATGEPSTAVEISADDNEAIAEVMFDLNRLLTSSFKEEGFDPSVLVIKILDAWHNLKTAGYWKDQLATGSGKDAKTIAKLIRARVLTNLAEFMGMRHIASDMTIAIATLQNIDNIYSPWFHKQDQGDGIETANGSDSLNVLDRRRKDILSRIQGVISMLPQSMRDRIGKSNSEGGPVDVCLQMPWAAAQLSQDESKTSSGQVVIFVREPKDLVMIQDDKDLTLDITPIDQTQALRATLYSLMGRATWDYTLRDNRGVAVARVRLEQPGDRWISTLRDTTLEGVEHTGPIPEANLLHTSICEYTGPEPTHDTSPLTLHRNEANPRLIHLLNFLFAPRIFIDNTTSHEDVPYIIIIKNKVFLATNKTQSTVWDMAQAEGLTKPVVRPYGSPQSHAVPVNRDDQHILDSLHAGGNLPFNIALVEEGRSDP